MKSAKQRKLRPLRYDSKQLTLGEIMEDLIRRSGIYPEDMVDWDAVRNLGNEPIAGYVQMPMTQAEFGAKFNRFLRPK